MDLCCDFPLCRAHIDILLSIFLHDQAIILLKQGYHDDLHILYLNFGFYFISFGALSCLYFVVEDSKKSLFFTCSSLCMALGFVPWGRQWRVTLRALGSLAYVLILVVQVVLSFSDLMYLWPIDAMSHDLFYLNVI